MWRWESLTYVIGCVYICMYYVCACVWVGKEDGEVRIEAQPFALEAKFFTECRLLNREVRVTFESTCEVPVVCVRLSVSCGELAGSCRLIAEGRGMTKLLSVSAGMVVMLSHCSCSRSLLRFPPLFASPDFVSNSARQVRKHLWYGDRAPGQYHRGIAQERSRPHRRLVRGTRR